jgi:hypothetical protein
MPTNDLYLGVLPLIHITPNQMLGFGLTEQTLTVYPDRNFATEFFADEVDNYMEIFISRANKYFVGGHSLSWEASKEQVEGGRYVVRVRQNVR